MGPRGPNEGKGNVPGAKAVPARHTNIGGARDVPVHRASSFFTPVRGWGVGIKAGRGYFMKNVSGSVLAAQAEFRSFPAWCLIFSFFPHHSFILFKANQAAFEEQLKAFLKKKIK